MRFLLLSIWGAAWLTGCAAPTHQTRELLGAEIPPAQLLTEVPFIAQGEGDCGPAALAMALGSVGYEVKVAELAVQTKTPLGRGSLPTDLISAARRNGLMAMRVEGLKNIAAEIRAGHPVIVFQNLGLSWWPKWHFAVVTGYDLGAQEIILHTGTRPFRREPLRFFERTWSLAEEWALVVLPAAELGSTPSELEHLRAASALEQLKFTKEAGQAYEAILKRWPESLGGLIGAANISFVVGQKKAAIGYLRKATKLHPDSIVARHNLDVALSGLE
jgi:hypothetical protein